MFVEEMKKRKKIVNSNYKLDGNCEHILDMAEVEKQFFDAKLAESQNMDPNRVA